MSLYKITVGDLTYFKSQQWSLTNHAFLLIAAVLAVRQLLGGSIAPYERFGLLVVVALIVVSALVLLKKLQDSIVVRQARLNAAREGLGLEFYRAWAAQDKKSEYIHAIWILRGALIIGGLIASWLLFRQPPV
jgi:hypothetical protein